MPRNMPSRDETDAHRLEATFRSFRLRIDPGQAFRDTALGQFEVAFQFIAPASSAAGVEASASPSVFTVT
jgi:hypothetical protein